MPNHSHRAVCAVLVIAVFLSFLPSSAQAAYRPVSSVVLTIGSPSMVVNEFTFPVDPGDSRVTPVVDPAWDRALVPVRCIVEQTGGDVTWAGTTKTVTVSLAGRRVEMTVGSPRARVDGRQVWIDSDHRVVPTISCGRTMAPARFVAESLGGMALWRASDRTITLTLPKQMISVMDMCGHTVTVPRRVIRIATVSSVATQLVFAVAAQDRLVVATFGPSVKGKAMGLIYPRMKDVPSAGDQNAANIETLLAARPDVVLTEDGAAFDRMIAAGLPAYAFSAEKQGELADAIKRLGSLTGHVAEAGSTVALLSAKMSGIREAVDTVPDSMLPRVYMAGSGILKTFGGDFFQTLMVRAAGGVSVSEQLPGGKIDVSPEQILVWNPDVIILTSYTRDSVQDVLNNPKLQNVAAIREKRVYLMPKYVVSWDMPVPESFLGTMWLAKKLHPDIMRFDMAEEIRRFYRQVYDFTVPEADVDVLAS